MQGDLGHTDLQEDLEFHSSNFTTDPSSSSRKIPGGSPGLPAPATAGSGSSKRFLWSLSFYAQFFDVDTSSVLQRCWAALYPRANFLDVLEGNPDLYGPIWIATTVVFILFLGGTISKYLAETGEGHFVYDFRLLSGMCLECYRRTAVTNRINRCCWSYIWLHIVRACCTLPRLEILRQRICQSYRVLGAIWLFESHLDPRSTHILVVDKNPELVVCGGWLWSQCCVSAEKPLSCSERNGEAN